MSDQGSKNTSNQCDQKAKLFVQYLAWKNNENLPNSKKWQGRFRE